MEEYHICQLFMMGHIYIIPIPRTRENTSTWHECKRLRAGITGQKADRPWPKANEKC